MLNENITHVVGISERASELVILLLGCKQGEGAAFGKNVIYLVGNNLSV